MAGNRVSTLPTYEGVGSRSTFPGPFACRDATMHTLVLDGDLQRITALVDRTLTGPAAGAVTYRPVGSRVLLMYGPNTVSSLDDRWRDSGEVLEHLAAFWVPVWAGRERNGRFEADRLCMSVPHIVVDNPISLVVGREVYGFPKALGQFTYGAGGGLTVDAYGGDFTAGERAGWRPLLEVTPPTLEAASADDGPVGLAGFIRSLAAALIDGFDAEAEGLVIPGGVRLAAHVCRDTLAGHSSMVFLKQFRDAREQGRACYQRVVEVPVRTLHVTPVLSRRHWDVKLHALASHPIAEDLGVASGPSRWAGELRKYAFDVGPGSLGGS